MAESTRSSTEGRNGHSTVAGEENHGGAHDQEHGANNVTQMLSMDDQKARVAEGLRGVATSLRERANGAPLPGADMAAEAAARPLESSAAYLEEHTPGDMWSDLMTYCRSHPAGALFIGFSTGYLFHKLFR